MRSTDTKHLSTNSNEPSSTDSRTVLDEILRQGARLLLTAAIQEEVDTYIREHAHLTDENGHRLVTRNGYQKPRAIQTSLGNIPIRQPRVNDKRAEQRFTSSILPKYLRKSPQLENLIPSLYLRGVSSNDMAAALEPVLGEEAKGLSSATVQRLKSDWESQLEQWQKRNLKGKKYVYFWADGIYFNVRLTEDRPCVLVIIGALEDGTKEVVAIYDGQRESKLSWKEILLGLKSRGLEKGPSLAVGDGALGFWAALEEEFPETGHQRCWVHKIANVLDKLPKAVQPSAKDLLHEIYQAPDRKNALSSMKKFGELYRAKYPKAVECLEKDQEELLRYLNYPAENWQHIRTTNPIESSFSGVRHRTQLTKGCGSRRATMAMVYQLLIQCESKWRKLKGAEHLPKVYAGQKYIDGKEVTEEIQG